MSHKECCTIFHFEKRIIFKTAKLVLGFIIVIFTSIQCQDTVPGFSLQKFCNLQKNCSACISLAPECAWCKYEANTSQFRCDLYADLLKYCPEKDIVNPQFDMDILEDKPLSQPGDSLESMVQVAPQRIALRLRPNSPQRIQMQFRQAKDFPVDLYYLMDVSVSMRDDKEKLANLGSQLGETMKNFTSDFTMGFGSFVDKKQMPFADMREDHIINPCLSNGEKCDPAYSFKNNLGLVDDISRFVEVVKNAEISANVDNPEGSLDALMQVILCKDKIGWRKRSKKIVLLATDGPFHTAGDGKLAGIVRPNDGECHLDDKNEYTESNNQDYPSVSQIIKSASENFVTVIFAAGSPNLGIYNELKELIPGARSAELAEDSQNIVELLEKHYKGMSETVKLKHDLEFTSDVKLQHESNEIVSVNYYTNCSQVSGEFVHQDHCTDLKMGSTVHFEVEIELKSCPKNRKQTLKISPIDLNEPIQIDMELMCDCECESAPNQQINSNKCSDIGTYECGICNCPRNRLGNFCECDANSMADQNDQTKCKRDEHSLICSGRGECTSCQKCQCFFDELNRGLIYGDYCECDDFSCPNHRYLLCGGHGKCICGQCFCESAWIGEHCGCPANNDSCYGKNQEICSGHGICECSVCQCDLGYTGKLCEIKLDIKKVCENSRPCIECAISSQFPENVTCLSEETGCNETYAIQVVDKSELGEPGDDERLCVYVDKDSCRVSYIIQEIENNNFTTSANVSKECVQAANLSWIAGVIVGIITVIGIIAILCWKLITTIKDNNEYARFEASQKKSKWEIDENPVYKSAVSYFANPTYERGKKEE